MSAVIPATAADLNELMDRLARDPTRESALAQGYSLYLAAQQAGLVENGDAARVGFWVGQLVRDGRVGSGPRLGRRDPVPPGVAWGDAELQEHTNFYVTASGRDDAAEHRRMRAAAAADAVLEGAVGEVWNQLSPEARAALSTHAARLREALEREDHARAIGAAKELVESGTKVALAGSDDESDKGKLPALFKRACVARGLPLSEVTQGLVSTLHGLAQLRNDNDGHGRAVPPPATAAQAAVSALAAMAALTYLFRSEPVAG